MSEQVSEEAVFSRVRRFLATRYYLSGDTAYRDARAVVAIVCSGAEAVPDPVQLTAAQAVRLDVFKGLLVYERRLPAGEEFLPLLLRISEAILTGVEPVLPVEGEGVAG